MRGFCVVTLILAGSVGCTHIFLQPSRDSFPFVYLEGVPFEEMTLATRDDLRLHAWWFDHSNVCARKEFKPHCHHSDPKPLAVILQLHGNGENMTTHYQSVAWLTLWGFDVMTFDYRGYGKSEGARSVSGAVSDSQTALRAAAARARDLGVPLIAYGQSLGGSLLLPAVTELPHPPGELKSLVIEGSFFSYPQIAREKLRLFWLTWPLQPLTYLLISNRWSPSRVPPQKLVDYKTLFIYSEEDPIVPLHHGQQLSQLLKREQDLWVIAEPGHVNVAFAKKGALRPELASRLKELAQ